MPKPEAVKGGLLFLGSSRLGGLVAVTVSAWRPGGQNTKAALREVVTEALDVIASGKPGFRHVCRCCPERHDAEARHGDHDHQRPLRQRGDRAQPGQVIGREHMVEG